MNIANSAGIFSKDAETHLDESLELFLRIPKVREIVEQAERIADDTEWAAFIETALAEYKGPQFLIDLSYYAAPEVLVYLMPGSFNAHLGEEALFAAVRKQVKLDDYTEKVFVFRNKSRDILIELRPGEVGISLIRHLDLCKRPCFIDPQWPDDETAVKTLPLGNFKTLLDRMRSAGKTA